MSTDWRIGPGLAAVAVLLVAGTLFLAIAPLGERANETVANSAVLVAVGFGAAACAWRARHTQYPRPWHLMTAAAGFAVLAETYWFTMVVLLQRTPAPTSPSDLLYLVTYVLFLAAFVAFFPPMASRESRARRVLDAFVVGTLLMAITWMVFLRSLVERADAGLADSLVVGAYPAVDLGIASVLVVWSAGMPRIQRQRILLMALGLVFFMVGSMWHAYDEVSGSMAAGSPKVMGWVGGYLTFALAARIGPATADARMQPAEGSRTDPFFIYLPLVVVLPLAAWDYARNGQLDAISFILGMLIIIGMAARQALFSLDLHGSTLRLRRSEQQLQEAQALARLGTWRVDLRQGRYTANPQHNMNWGFAPGATGLTMEILMKRVHPDDRRLVSDANERSASSPDRQEFDHRVVWPDGTIHWLHEIGNPELDADGSPVAVIGTSQDITAQKEAEMQLHQAQSRMAGILDSQRTLIVRVDASNRITYMNDAYQHTFGLKLGDSFWVKVHPDDAEATKKALDQLSTAPFRCSVEQRCEIDGEWRWIYWEDSVVRDSHGNMAEIQGVGLDVTDRKLAQQHVESVHAELEALVSAAPLPIVGLDERGLVLHWNAAATHVFGWSSPEVVGKRLPIIPESGTAAFGADLARLRKGQSIDEEVHPVTRDGRQLTVRLHVAPLLDDEGKYRGCVALLDDLTEKRRSQEQLRAASDRERSLKELAEFKTRFLNTAAHELATPLTPLKLQLASLRSGHFGEVAPGQRAAVELLERNLDRMARLVGDLLDAARLQSGSLRLQLHQIDLNEIATDVGHSFQAKAHEEGVQLKVETDGPALAEVDPDRVTQVLFNLVHNALKFTPRGGSIAVTVRHDDRGATIDVRDTGAGLDRAQIDQLFQPFTQVHGVGPVKKGGTGLGLYISRGIAEQHGGTLTVSSLGADAGSTFRLMLPAHPPKRLASGASAKASAEETSLEPNAEATALPSSPSASRGAPPRDRR